MKFKICLFLSRRCMFIILIFFLQTNCQCIAQTNPEIDSILNLLKSKEPDTQKVNLLNDLSNKLQLISEYEKAKTYSIEALQLAQNLKYSLGEAIAYKIAGQIFSGLGNFSEALKNNKASLKIYQEIGNKKGIAEELINIGLNYWLQGQYSKAIECYFAGLKIYDELGNKLGQAKAYNNIAIIYDLQKNTTEALKNYQLALEIVEALNNEYGIAVCKTNIGIINADTKQCQSSLDNHSAALAIWQKIGEKSGAANSYINIGEAYICLGNYKEALQNYQTAIKLAEEIGAKYEAAGAYIRSGETFMRLNQYQEAQINLTKGFALSKEVGSLKNIRDYYDILSQLNMRMHNFENALVNFKQTIIYKDSLLNETNNQQITQIKEEYESEKKDKEILNLTKEKSILEHEQQIHSLVLKAKQDSLNLSQYEKDKTQLENEKYFAQDLYSRKQLELMNNEKKLQQLASDKDKADFAVQKIEADKKHEQIINEKGIQELELKKEKLTKNYFIGALGLFFVLSILIYRNYHSRQEIKLLTLRNKIASDLHDDVGSTLSSISMFSQLAQSQSKELIPTLETIGESSRKMLDAMADIVWSIKPENDQFDKVLMRMREFAFELLGASQIDFEFDAAEEIPNVNLSMEERKNLYLIFKEAANNLAKYSDASRAKFALKIEKDILIMKISDNGKGFDITKYSKGNGLINMRKRAEELGAKLTIDSAPGHGTILEFKLAV